MTLGEQRRKALELLAPPPSRHDHSGRRKAPWATRAPTKPATTTPMAASRASRGSASSKPSIIGVLAERHARHLAERALPLHANPGLLAQSGGNLVLNPARPVAARCLLYLGQTTQGAHRCLHQGLQHHCRSVCLDQVRGPSKTPQTTFRETMIPGTSAAPASRLHPAFRDAL